ncbi:MAG: hypothetical protein KF681_01120 [Bdellovibrionaceae bacterium]|nr:hypothetical protein [Pseudobdellovibrionaceae bacterium]
MKVIKDKFRSVYLLVGVGLFLSGCIQPFSTSAQESSSGQNELEPINLPVLFARSPNAINLSYQKIQTDFGGELTPPASGAVGSAPAGYSYGGNKTVESQGLLIAPPVDRNDFSKVIFPIVRMAPQKTWNINFKAGIANLGSPTAPLVLKLVVSSNDQIIGEKAWEILKTWTIAAGVEESVSFPLGLWAMRSNLVVALQVQKQSATSESPILVLSDLKLTADENRPELGMIRSGLVWASQQDRIRQILGAAQTGAKWFRDGFDRPLNGVSDFVEIVRLANANGMKMLALVTPTIHDFDSGYVAAYHDSADFQSLCGWMGGIPKYSEINYSKFRARLQGQIAAVKAAGLEIEAFEIGNEVDWVCFNGDLPLDRMPSELELQAAAKAYAFFLLNAATVIHSPANFPTAKIVTFGMANIVHVSRAHIPDPGAFLRRLENIEGFDFLMLADGLGTHVYTDAYDLSGGRSVLEKNASDFGLPAKSWWVTEWGYDTTRYKTSNNLQLLPDDELAQKRAESFLSFLHMANSQPVEKLGPIFLYAYRSPYEPIAPSLIPSGSKRFERFSLVDVDGIPYPEVDIFKTRYRFDSK